METTIVCWGLSRDNGKEAGNYFRMLMFSGDNLGLTLIRRCYTSQISQLNPAGDGGNSWSFPGFGFFDAWLSAPNVVTLGIARG